MKTIGLIGGMSWESTLSYYKLLNEGIKARLGGLHSAKIILYSVDFEPIARLQNEGKWEEAALIITFSLLANTLMSTPVPYRNQNQTKHSHTSFITKITPQRNQ